MKELAEIIGISQDGIKFNLARLKAESRIIRTGPTKGGRWEIL